MFVKLGCLHGSLVGSKSSSDKFWVNLYLANEWDFRYPTELGFLGKTRRKFGEDLRKTRSSDLGGNYVV
ncbi:hypothetical protein HanRHA438_Chr05g0233351 [Helianthus annuus]|nr:hypothetical protein HanRHA438_Chr05g0233351 [Helianthus annuus]